MSDEQFPPSAVPPRLESTGEWYWPSTSIPLDEVTVEEEGVVGEDKHILFFGNKEIALGGAVCLTVGFLGYVLGRERQRSWVDQWTGGPG